MKVQAALLLLLSAAVAVHCFSTGAPSQACTNIYPEGHVGPSKDCSTNSFRLSLSDFDETYGGEFYYVPRQNYTLTLSESGGEEFRGFLVQARTVADGSPVGVFQDPGAADYKLSACTPSESAVTHTSNNIKTSVTFTWTAPPQGTVSIMFLFAVVVQNSGGVSTFYATCETDVINSCGLPLFEFSGQCVETCPPMYIGTGDEEALNGTCEPFPTDYVALLNATVYYAEISTETPMNTPVFRIRLSLDIDEDPLVVSLTFNQNQMIQDLFEFDNGENNGIEITFPSDFQELDNEYIFDTSLNYVAEPEVIQSDIELSITIVLSILQGNLSPYESSARAIGTIFLAPDPCTSSSCDNGGSCSASNSMTFTCTCPSGYTGTTCGVDIDECESAPCSNGGTCVDLVADFQCTCQPGYTGDTCDIITDPCDPNPCSNGGTCLEEFGSTTGCNCTSGFTGEFCTENDPSDLFCHTTSCANGGTCNEEFGPAISCTCSPGYTGENCTMDDTNAIFCSAITCLNGGTCMEDLGPDTSCQCTHGFMGDSCSEDDPSERFCLEETCANGGTCEEDFGPATTCICAPGYTSDSCGEDNPGQIFCQASSCANGGTCNEEFGSATTCTCARGYTGNFCENDNPEEQFCESDSCANGGTCSEELGPEISCQCSPGYTGLDCATEIEECFNGTCLNGGTCMIQEGMVVVCLCPPHYTGSNCSINLTSCDFNMCMNGGTCVEDGPSTTCICAVGFSGSICDQDLDYCETDSCSNGGTCEEGVGTNISCACPSGFSGYICEIDDPFCSDDICLNGGTCVEGVGTATSCECAVGYDGERCQTELPSCVSSSCLNGGTCYEASGQEVICGCPPRFTGKQCEVAICLTESEVPVYPGSDIVYNWTQTEAENSQTQQCPDTCQDLINYPTGAVVVRDCRLTEGGAEWQDTNTTGCGFDAITLQLCEASQLESDEEIAAVVVNITAEASTLVSSALTVSGYIIQGLTDAAIEQPEVRENYLKIIDNVLEADMDMLLESQTKSNSSTKILQGLNRFIDLVPVDNQTGNVTFTLNNFGLIALDTDLLNQTRVQAFSANLGPVTDAISNRDTISANQLLVTADPISNATGSIEIQDLNLCPLQNSSQRIAYSVFRTDALFLTPETGCTNFTVGSIILGVRANISQRCNTTSVIVDMEHLQEVCSGMHLPMNQQPICSNYDEKDTDGVGRWSQDNCRRVHGSRGRTICDCSQLGHFGLLFDLNPGESLSPLALAIISYVGAILSIICLLIVVLTYVISRLLRRKEHGKLLINMSVSLICLYVVFMIAGLVTSVEVLCGLVSALFQYFMLVFFGWTAAQAVNLYYKLVRVLGEPIEHYVLKAALIVWLAPILIVVISVGPGYSYYVNPYYCRATEWPFWFGLILPFGVIYIFNWVIFTIIMMKLLKATKVDIPNNVNTRVSKQNFIIAVGLSLLFGLGWGFGLTATSSNTKEVTFAFQVIFSLFVGSQGILIFFFHGIRSPDFRKVWKSIFCPFQQKKYTVSSRGQRKINSPYNMATLNKTGSLPLHSGPMFHSNTEKFSSDSLSGHDTLVTMKEDVTHFQEDVDEKTDLGKAEAEEQNQSVGETATIEINARRATDIPETRGKEKAVLTLEDAESKIPAKT